jgi:ipoprotein LpqH
VVKRGFRVAVASKGDSPTVQTVGLGNVKISDTATGVDMTNPMQPITKPFGIEVTCP